MNARTLIEAESVKAYLTRQHLKQRGGTVKYTPVYANPPSGFLHLHLKNGTIRELGVVAWRDGSWWIDRLGPYVQHYIISPVVDRPFATKEELARTLVNALGRPNETKGRIDMNF